MEKLIFFLLLPTFLWAQKLEQLQLQKIESNLKVGSFRYGGISGLSWGSDGFLWAVSDDRGSMGPARIYKQSLTSQTVKPLNQVLLGDVKGYSVLDLEALYLFKDGDLLLSSEGDFDRKPRVMPFVKFWNEKTKWKKDEIPLADELFPEKIGMQTKGLQNNSGFEAMTVSSDEKTLYLISEVPLYQSQKSECELLQYGFKDKKWTLENRKAYIRDTPSTGSFEVMRGVSEVLYWKKDHLLVLERWVRLQKDHPMAIGAELFSVDLINMKKKKLFTLDGDLLANWEGMAWGPDLSDGRKQLILVSDNNFVKLTPTFYLFLAFKEETP